VRIHYSGRDVVVTSELFVRCEPWETFAIRDLRNVYVTREEADGSNAAALFAGAGAVLASATLIYSVAGPWVAIALLALAAVGVACFVVWWQHRPHRQVLRAEYQGVLVVLYASADMRVFNQVKRALQRAMENRPPMSWLGVAA
jgi:hypothetical protein